MKKICVMGLGYIGLPTSCMFANNGFEVLGVDVDEDIIGKLNSGKVHIDELRTVINNLRLFRGFQAYNWTDSSLQAGTSIIRKVHIDELRSKLADPVTYVGESCNYTDPSIQPGVTPIRRSHITELRDFCTKQ